MTTKPTFKDTFSDEDREALERSAELNIRVAEDLARRFGKTPTGNLSSRAAEREAASAPVLDEFTRELGRMMYAEMHKPHDDEDGDGEFCYRDQWGRPCDALGTVDWRRVPNRS